MANPKSLRDLHRAMISDGVVSKGYDHMVSTVGAKGDKGIKNRQVLYNIATEGGYFTGSYADFAKAYFRPATPQKEQQDAQKKQQIRDLTGRDTKPAQQPQKPAATPQGQKPAPVQQQKATPNKPDSVAQQYMPTYPDPTKTTGQSKNKPKQGTGVLKTDAQIMADDSLSAADKVALINDNRRRRGQRQRTFNGPAYEETARDLGVIADNPVEGFTESVEAGFQPDPFFTDTEGNVLGYKPNYVNKSPVTQYNDRIKEIADEINYYNTKQDQGGGGTTRIEDAINAAYDKFMGRIDQRGAMANAWANVGDPMTSSYLENLELERTAGIDAVAKAAYDSFPQEVKDKYGEDVVRDAVYQVTFNTLKEKSRPKNYGAYLAQQLTNTVPGIISKAIVRRNSGSSVTLSDIADMSSAEYAQQFENEGLMGDIKSAVGGALPMVADPTMLIPFGGPAAKVVTTGLGKLAAKQAIGRGLEAGAVKLASKAAANKLINRGLTGAASTAVQMAAYEEAVGLANMANGSGQNFWDVTGEAVLSGAKMAPIGFIAPGARVLKGRVATSIADQGLSRGMNWAANTGAKLGISTAAFMTEAGVFAAPDIIGLAVNGTYTNEQARDIAIHSIATLAAFKASGMFNPLHIEQTKAMVQSMVKGTMGTELALNRHDSDALERLGYPKIQGDNIMSLFMPLGERPQAKEGGGYFSMYSQIVLDERVPWSTRAKLIYVATGMLPETGVRPNSVRKTTDENGRIVVTTLQGNNPISQRFFDKKHSASADSYLRKVSHDVERMNFEGTKQDITNEYLGGISRSQLLNDALAKDPKARTPEEQKLVDDYNHEVWVAEDLMAGYARRTVMYDDKLPDPEKALKKPAWERSEQEQRAVERYGVALNNKLDEIRSNNYSQIAFDLADKDSFDATKEMSNKQDGNLYQCQLRGEEGVWYTVVDFDGTIEQGETGMDVTPGANGDKMMVRNMSTGETKMVTLAELTNLSTDRYFDVRNSLTETFYNNYLNSFLESRRKLSFFGKQPQNAEEGERLTLAADDVDPTTGLRPEYVVLDKDGKSGTYVVEDAQGNRKLINGHDILQKITDVEPQIPTQIAPQVPPTGPQTPPPAAPAQEPPVQPQGEAPALPEQGDVFKLKVGDEFKDAEVIGKDDTGIIVRYEDNGTFRTEHLTPEELAPRMAPSRPVVPNIDPKDMTNEAIARELQILEDYDHHPATTDFDGDLVLRRDLLREELARRQSAPVTPPAQGEGEGGAPAAPENGIPEDENGNKLFHKAEPKAVEDYFKNEKGYDDRFIAAIADKRISEAQKDLADAAAKREKAYADVDEQAMDEAIAAERDAQERLDWWNKFKEGYNQEQPAGEQPPVVEGGGEPDIPHSEPMPARKSVPVAPARQEPTTPEEKAAAHAENVQRWNNAPKVYGHTVVITLPNGEMHRARYVLSTHDAATASHDALHGYMSTPGYPEDNGRNANDRDYTDKDNQVTTERIANDFNGLAFQNPPIVNTGSEAGHLLGGNGTKQAHDISITLGAEGKDGKYLDATDENIPTTGISRRAFRDFLQNVDGHPMVYLELVDEVPHDTATMKKFNDETMKSNNSAQSTLKIARLLTDSEIIDLDKALNLMKGDDLEDLMGKPTVAGAVLKVLVDGGYIGQNQVAQYTEGNGTLSARGIELVRELIRGTILDERAIKALNMSTDKYSLADVKRRIDQLAVQLVHNASLGDFSLKNEISRAVEFIQQTYSAWNGKGSREAALRSALKLDGGDIDFEGMTEDEIASERIARILSQVLTSFRHNKDYKVQTSLKIDDAVAFFEEYERNVQKAMKDAKSPSDLWGKKETREDVLKFLLTLKKYKDLFLQKDNGPEQQGQQAEPGETETPGGNGGGNQGNGGPSGTSGTGGEGGTGAGRGTGEGEGPRSGEGPVTPPRPGAPQGGGEPPKGEGEPPKPEEPGKPAGEPAGGPAASEPHQLTVDEVNSLDLPQRTKDNAIAYINGDTESLKTRNAYQRALREWERVNGKSGEGKPETPPATPEDNGPQEPPKGGGGGTSGRGGGKPSTPKGGGKPTEPKPAEPKPEGEGPKNNGGLDLSGLGRLKGFKGVFGEKRNESRRPSREGEIVNEARYIPEEATEEQLEAVEATIEELAKIGKQLVELQGMRTQSELVDFMRGTTEIREALEDIGFDDEDMSTIFREMWSEKVSTPKGDMKLSEYADELSKTDKPKADDKPKQIVSPMEPTVKNVVYKPTSKGKANESIIPAAMVQAVKTALSKVNNGDVDGFVLDKVGFKDKDEMYEALNAEQIDGVALAISAIERGEGLILGDMTGIGKGRQLAAVIRYARKNGIRPVFVTEKPGLFKDMMRDLLDVGADTPQKPFRPLIIASDSDADVIIADGSKVKRADAETIEKMLTGDFDKLAKGYDALFVTYDNTNQLAPDTFFKDQGVKKPGKEHDAKKEKKDPPELTKKKLNLIAKWARGSIVVMDEAHNAAGVDSNRAIQWRQIIDTTSGVGAKGVVMASATYAKTPKNYVLYALRTPIKEAHLSTERLEKMFARGGVPLQEWLAGQLTGESYIRRERDMTGVNFDYRICVDGYDTENPEKSTPEALAKVKAIRESNDKAAGIANTLLMLDNKAKEAFNKIKAILVPGKGKGGAVEVLVKQADGTYQKELINAANYKGQLEMSTHNFSSEIAQVNAQLFMAEKAESAADAAIASIKKGELPMIVFENTFDSLMKALPVDENGRLESADYAQAFVRYLERLGNFKITLPQKNPDDPVEYLNCRIDLSGDPEFRAVKRMIENVGVGLHVSPVDRMRERIEEAGYKVGELSGREYSIEKLPDGRYHRTKRKTENPDKVTDDYNTGKIDVLLINASGSTGRSMHQKGTWDEEGNKVPGTTQSGEPMMMKPRHQIYVQNFNNETTMVQAMGRIDRTGQVEHGKYTFLMTPVPAETNILMRAQRKREQLKANTTAQQDRSSFDAVNASDFINKYGDRVVAEYLEDNPKLMSAMQLKKADLYDTKTGKPKEGLAKKATTNAYTLTCEQQQEFYDNVQSAYDEYVKVLKENNDYDLETQVVDLQAQTIIEHMFVRGSHESDSMFSQDTNIARCRVKIQRKPLKLEDIEKHIIERTGTEDQYEWDDKFREQFEKHFENMRNEVEEEFKNKPQNVDTDGKKNEKLGKISVFRDAAKKVVDAFPLDLLMPFYSDTSDVEDARGAIDDGGPKPHAIVYDIKLGRTLGSSTVIFAVNDGRQKVSVRMNDENTIKYLKMLQTQPADKDPFKREDWNKAQGEAFEDAFIITGNLIGAYHSDVALKGRMIRYTDSEGNLKTGILMPRNFKTSDIRVIKPISEFYNTLIQFSKNRKKEDLPKFADGNLMVENDRNYQNSLRFIAKGELGDSLYADPDLSPFFKSRNEKSKLTRFEVTKWNDDHDDIKKFLGILAGRYGVTAPAAIDPAYFMTREERDKEAEARMFRVNPNIEERTTRYGTKLYVVHVPKERRKNVDATSNWLANTIRELKDNGFSGAVDYARSLEGVNRVYDEFRFEKEMMAKEFVKMINDEPVRPLAVDERVEAKEPDWEEVDRSQHTYKFAEPGLQLVGDDIAKTFGFRKVDTGHTNSDGVRELYNAFMTMALILNIDPKSISLGGNMDVNVLNDAVANHEIGANAVAAFSISGKANSYTSATNKRMIFRAGKSVFPLAHEWLHALDNYFGSFGLKNEETGYYEQARYASESADRPNRPWTARDEVRGAFADLLKSLVESGFYGRLENEHFFKNSNFTDSSMRPKYWGERTEMLARAFEVYMRKKINDNKENLWLRNGKIDDIHKRMLDMIADGNNITSGEFDPKPEEQAVIDKAFDKFFETIREKRDPDTGRVIMYEQAKPGETKREATMRETRNLNRVLAKTGLANSVTIDSERDFAEGVFASTGRPLRTLDGIVYGYTDSDGNIHLNAKYLNFETPIHEYGHLWSAWAKKNHGDLWQRGIELAKESDAFKKLKQEAQKEGSVYRGMTDDQLADEVLADAIGKKGQDMYDPKDWTRTARVRHWLTQLWHRIGEALGFRKRMPNMAVGDMSFDDIIRTAAGEVLGGKRLKGAKGRGKVNFAQGWHGSGADFDAFDNTHIGEGEGHQSHGYGIYIAKNKDIAKGYATSWLRYKGEPIPWSRIGDKFNPEVYAVQSIADHLTAGEDFNTAVQTLKKRAQQMIDTAGSELERKGWEDVLSALSGMKQEDFNRVLYEVDIPDDNGHNYLDEEAKVPTELWDKFVKSFRGDNRKWAEGIREKHENESDYLVRDFQQMLSYTLSGKMHSKKASEKLSKWGYVGIKYKGNIDGDCYVVFNDSDVKIKEKTRFQASSNEQIDRYPNGEIKEVRNYDADGNLTRLLRYDENRRLIRHWQSDIETDWTRDENGVARGMSNGVEIKPYNFRFQQVAEPVKQAISSADTSLNQVASGLRSAPLQPGTTNFDLGGGRFDKGTEYLAEKGVENVVFDPFNRDAEHNQKAFEIVRNGGFDSVTCNNVLNVIAEPDVRSNVVLQAAKALKQGGTAYFTVYEGSGNGEGKETSKGWQNNRKTADYMEEIGQHFGSVERKGKLIIAKDPITDGKADWFMDAQQEEPIRFQAGSPIGNNEQLHIAREYAQDRTRTTTKLYEEVVENSVSLRHVLEDIARKSGKPIADYENVYLAENQSHGMMTTELITFRDRRVNPLNDALRKLAKHYGGEPTKNYVWARHGIERSIYVCFRERAYELAEKEAEAAARARGEEVTDKDINDAYNAMLDELYNATSGYSRRAYLENLETECSNILSAHGNTKPFEVTDKAGLTALNDKRSLVDDKPIENAWEIVKEYENNAGTEGEADVEALFDRLNDISKSMLDYSRDKGMMDKDTVEKIRKMFRFYVPLQGFAEGTMAQDYFEYVDSNPMRAGRAVPNTPKMRGRTGESADPIATLVRNAEMTIAAARRNTVATHLYNLATSRDTDLFAPARAWEAYDAAEDTWVPSTPDFTGCETTKDMMDAIRLHDEQMRQQRELGLAREARRGFSNRLITAQGAPKGLKMSMRQRHEHAVPVRINGKENVIYVLSDPRIAQIVNGTDKGRVDKDNAAFLNAMARLTRFRAGLMTSYSIPFWFRNGARDIQNAFLRQAIMNGGSAAARTALQGFKGDPFGMVPWEAMRLYSKAVKGTLDESNKHERYFKEFFEHGGITGYAFAEQAEKIQSRVKKLLEHPNRSGRRLMFAVGEWLERSGGAFEIAPRFAAYIAGRDSGKSIMQSVADAKEATVNFDRRGARRSWLMRTVAALYAFHNPGVQGMQNRLHMWRTKPTKTTILHAAGFVMGHMWKAAAVAMLIALNRKDDEYDTQLTEHDRRNNLCFPVGDDDWVKIPINMEDRVMFGIGDAVRDNLDVFNGNRYFGGKEKSEYDDGGSDLLEYMKLISAWFPIDPASENNWVPTNLQPFYDVYVNHKDYRGQAVDWRSERNAQEPEYKRINPSMTSKMWVNASKWWSEKGGGTSVRRAKDEWHEINPQHMQYLFQSFLGGLGSTLGQVESLVETMASDDEEVKWNSFKFPIASSFWKGNLSEYSSTKDDRKKSSVWRNWADEVIRIDREYRKRGAEHEGEDNKLTDRDKEDYKDNLRYLELAKRIHSLADKKSQAKKKATKEGRMLSEDEESEIDNAFNDNIPDFEQEFVKIDGERKAPDFRKHYDDD